MPHISDEAEQARIRAMFAELYNFEKLPDVVDMIDNTRIDLLGVIEPPIPCCADKHECHGDLGA